MRRTPVRLRVRNRTDDGEEGGDDARIELVNAG
jgi:hypothetical protein